MSFIRNEILNDIAHAEDIAGKVSKRNGICLEDIFIDELLCDIIENRMGSIDLNEHDAEEENNENLESDMLENNSDLENFLALLQLQQEIFSTNDCIDNCGCSINHPHILCDQPFCSERSCTPMSYFICRNVCNKSLQKCASCVKLRCEECPCTNHCKNLKLESKSKVTCCTKLSESKGKRSKKKKLKNSELKLKPRSWFLENNANLENRLLGLRKRKKSVCCSCYTYRDMNQHQSCMVAQTLTNAFVQELVQSHPAVIGKAKNEICLCRKQKLLDCL